MLEDVPRIFEAVFQCTLEVVMLFLSLLLFMYIMTQHLLIYSVYHQMITKNFEDYPEHRLKFFSLLRAIGTHCFQALIQLSSQVSSNLFCFLVLRWIIDLKYVNFRFYVLSDYWTIYFSNWSLWLTQLIGRSDIQREILQRQDLVYCWKFWRIFRWENMFHPALSAYSLMEANYSDIMSLQASGFQNQFYKTYFLTIEQEIFAVLTDTFHKPGFKLHVLVLQHLFCVVCLYSPPSPVDYYFIPDLFI